MIQAHVRVIDDCFFLHKFENSSIYIQNLQLHHKGDAKISEIVIQVHVRVIDYVIG